MKSVTVIKTKTPTEGNADCPWSIGVMNLTELEADLIRQFANGIRSINSPRANGYTATEMRQIIEAKRGPLTTDMPSTFMGMPVEEVARLISEKQNSRGVSGPGPRSTSYQVYDDAGRAELVRLKQEARRIDQGIDSAERKKYWTGDWDKDTKPEAEPDEPRNRFSGLELPDDKA